MKPRLSDLRESAVSLRQSGQSLKSIHHHLGVPLSTLSGWLKDVKLTDEQRQRLDQNHKAALDVARLKAIDWHRSQKTLRLLEAKKAAEATLSQLDMSRATLDLALAMLYFGEGAKTNDQTTIASSDPRILKLVIVVLRTNYELEPANFRCDLHLRMDQDPQQAKEFWSKELGIPMTQFKYVAFDKRSLGKKTYDNYPGVCVLYCANVAIQRKLIYLYTLFCEKIASIDLGT